jgi:DNA-binding NarL/FixJ family response regulator
MTRKLDHDIAAVADMWIQIAEIVTQPATPSPRELELLALIADGFSDTEIADALSLSPKTIRRRVHMIHVKLRARSRPHAVAIALRRGLIPFPAAQPMPPPLPA